MTLRTVLPPHNYKYFPGSKLFNQLLDCEIYSYEAFGIDRLLWVEQELDGKTHAHLVNARGNHWEYMGTYDSIAEGSCGCVRPLWKA